MTFDERVQRYEAEGMTRSDAQGIVDLEDMRAAKKGSRMSTHTPGPWSVEAIEAPVYGSNGRLMEVGVGIGAGSTHIATVRGRQKEANAALIAAAPELLKRLKIMCEFVRADLEKERVAGNIHFRLSYQQAQLEDAESAIAKAEGRG